MKPEATCTPSSRANITYLADMPERLEDAVQVA